MPGAALLPPQLLDAALALLVAGLVASLIQYGFCGARAPSPPKAPMTDARTAPLREFKVAGARSRARVFFFSSRGS